MNLNEIDTSKLSPEELEDLQYTMAFFNLILNLTSNLDHKTIQQDPTKVLPFIKEYFVLKTDEEPRRETSNSYFDELISKLM